MNIVSPSVVERVLTQRIADFKSNNPHFIIITCTIISI